VERARLGEVVAITPLRAPGYPSRVTLLLLVRHGLTDATGKHLSGRTRGIHLSETGRTQADRLVERLAGVPIKAFYSSPLERCVETARPPARARGLDVRIEPRLIEVDYGRWTGRSMAQLVRTTLWKQVQSSPSSIRFPEGETLRDVQLRTVEALDEIAAGNPKAVVAAVAHADVIRLAVAHYTGVHLDLFQRLIVSPVSVSAILLGDRVPRVLRLNDTGSLEDLVPRGRGRPPPRAHTRGPGTVRG
jgi:probable phosphomutase (TIGR03848 family)